jgi:hypothetical protein
MEHIHQQRLIKEKHRASNRKLLQMSLFHCKPLPDLQQYLQTGMLTFFHITCYFQAYTLSIRPKQPEIYVTKVVNLLTSAYDDFMVTKLLGRYCDPGITESILRKHPQLLNFYVPSVAAVGSLRHKGNNNSSSSSHSYSSHAVTGKKPAKSPSPSHRHRQHATTTQPSHGYVANLDSSITVEEILEQRVRIKVDVSDKQVVGLKILAHYAADKLVHHFSSLMISKVSQPLHRC